MRNGRAALLIATALCGASFESRAWADAPPAAAPAADTSADTTGDAESLIARGVALRHEGKDAEALKVFRRAYDQTPTARARAQIGLAEQALGMWLEAERDLTAALADPNDAWVRQYKDPLQSSLTAVKARLGSLEIVVNVPHADVLVDGAKVGTAPGPALRVVAGSRTVLVHADAYHPISRSVVVPGGGVARETFELAPLPPQTTEPGAARSETGAPGAGGEGAPTTSQRTLGWALLGGGALVLAGGGVAQIVQQIAVSDYNDYGNKSCPGAASPSQPPPCDRLLAKAERWQTVAIVGFATGGALAIAGTILVVTAPRTPSSSPSAARTATICNGVPVTRGFGAALVCEGRF